MLIVQGDEYPTHALSNITISLSKTQGLFRGIMPFCSPYQSIPIYPIAFAENGALHGFTTPGIFNYEIGNQLHYKTVLEDGLTGTTIPSERITKHEAFTIESSVLDLANGTVSYSLKREMWEESKTYTPNGSGGYDIATNEMAVVDTVIWDNSNLEDFFLTEMPRGLDTTNGLPFNYSNTSFERIGNFRLTHNTN